MTTPIPRLLSAREVAQMIGVSTETVLRWQRAGKIPAIKLPGGAIRFREDGLEVWLGQRATPRRGVLTTTTDAARPGVSSSALTTTEDEED